MKIASIVGARPQFVKAAPVSRAIREAAAAGRDIAEILVHTGQHYDGNMSDIFFEELGISAPDYNLGVGSASHGVQTGAMLAAIERVLEKERPDWVLIYGDTNSTLAGALAAAKMRLPIAHVEAGLRSYDRRMPEEINRIVADQLSTALFCPSRNAAANLRKEGIRDGVSIVGDVMAEALEYAVVRSMREAEEKPGSGEYGYVLATVHRAENTDDPARLRNILKALEAIGRIRPVVFPVHPRTKKMIAAAGWKPAAKGPEKSGARRAKTTAGAGIRFIDPVGYLEMARLESGAEMILTDSGGVQKEAYWLKVPCITLRDRTEWVETVASGWNVLAGTDTKKIIRAAENFTIPEKSAPLYGRGPKSAAPASRRIVDILLKS
ncbi:MAG: UDP-N-acetylglucosamine 2-epimerase (non-hydrolyzing) [Acidobacteriota bacterium]|jgi:UDP-N-acetylglucosamine 2-epimerase|nr:UDP-N-acetylglucosamine 2-epimerase (non-hydrolyzing) [Acidobacteriota bacterium]OQB55443.1 MAG: UDP-2,3-diacetamido-2,3-dideoxy-D-glucuronate 2-epimerase [Candidatus Aminicenantes bacterium ADurb.Bin147]HNT32712.1 UDP-N-acetylglucosamine 2-epimerase (non-hydrolyzing) [Candidatus Aminicenantes bacterium]MDD8028418.1 UDP-N-acetylglucosamine 2-epimerase (non-hydrolyzing) [Acidobacteriota bacterium]MDD8032516.1 UDP-N-acetylglucosamine 2-epimerase (non-hydrolyzing) [Acidobacteriota bacterium]